MKLCIFMMCCLLCIIVFMGFWLFFNLTLGQSDLAALLLILKNKVYLCLQSGPASMRRSFYLTLHFTVSHPVWE